MELNIDCLVVSTIQDEHGFHVKIKLGVSHEFQHGIIIMRGSVQEVLIPITPEQFHQIKLGPNKLVMKI